MGNGAGKKWNGGGEREIFFVRHFFPIQVGVAKIQGLPPPPPRTLLSKMLFNFWTQN